MDFYDYPATKLKLITELSKFLEKKFFIFSYFVRRDESSFPSVQDKKITFYTFACKYLNIVK